VAVGGSEKALEMDEPPENIHEIERGDSNRGAWVGPGFFRDKIRKGEKTWQKRW